MKIPQQPATLVSAEQRPIGVVPSVVLAALSSQQKQMLNECCRYSVSDLNGEYYRLGGHGMVSIRYNHRTLYKLRDLKLVEHVGYWQATELGRSVNAAN